MYKKLGSSLGLALAILIAFASIAAAQTDCPQGYAEDGYPRPGHCETSSSDSTITGDDSGACLSPKVWKSAHVGTCSTHGDGSDANAPDVYTSTFGLQMLQDTAFELAPVAIGIIAAIFGFLLTFTLLRGGLRKGSRAMTRTI